MIETEKQNHIQQQNEDTPQGNTENKELSRLERLNLIALMAASVSHEIRNPMTAVRGFLQFLMGKDEFKQHRSYFELMISELDRANSIITEYLSLARNKPADIKEHDINNIIKTMCPLIEANTVNAGIDTCFKLEDVPRLPVNENEFRQLVLNLVQNAIEAMSPGKILTIKTYTENDTIVLSVSDQGKGINPEIEGYIGTPFFTTKEKGTGLGLGLCFGIAARYNAKIDFDTGPEGTTFYVRFKNPEMEQ